MIRAALISLIVSVAAAGAAERRYVTDEEAAAWSGVGVLSVAGGGSCSGVLIRPDKVLTAAHCVADADAGILRAARNVTFSAGVKDGRSLQTVRARTVKVHPGYFVASDRYDERRVRVDVATVTLAAPVTAASAYTLGQTPAAGADVALLSYPGARRERASIQAPCRITGRRTEFMELDCASAPGASGSPVFMIGADGAPRVVGVLSGRRFSRGGATLALALAHVRDFIGPTGPDAARSVGAGTSIPAPGARLPGGSVAGEGLKRFRQ